MKRILAPARKEHLGQVLPWITSPEALRLWGGSALTYPPQLERTWGEIGADSTNTYVLMDEGQAVVGFGQVLPRPADTVHLGRIILAPEQRGQGLGRELCERLIQVAYASSHPRRITLNVYCHNVPAVRLYTSLGFKVRTEDAVEDSYFMELLVDRPEEP